MTGAKRSRRRGDLEKGIAEIPLGEAPQERDAKGEAEILVKREGKRSLQAFIPLATSLTTPPEAFAFYFQARGT